MFVLIIQKVANKANLKRFLNVMHTISFLLMHVATFLNAWATNISTSLPSVLTDIYLSNYFTTSVLISIFQYKPDGSAGLL